MTIAGAIAYWPQQNTAAKAVSAQPQLTPAPALVPQQSPALRAVLVKLPPPRAQLICLPEWGMGEQRPVTMPYGIQVLA